MNVTPIYQLGYFIPNMVIGSNLDLDQNRFTTIENQLYNLYNIFGNGVVARFDASGAKLPSWNLSSVANAASIQISEGSGHISFIYTETVASFKLNLSLPAGATTVTFYIYAIKTSTSPVDKSVEFISSVTQINDPVNYICLGTATLSFDSNGNPLVSVTNTGRQEISLYGSLTSLVSNHLHIGGANNPSPIDLSKHVTGFLSSENIDQLDLSKVTSGTLDANRLPQIDHNTLQNIGTLTHAQIDSLLAAIQASDNYPAENYNISDYGIVNRLQIILALKKQTGFFNIDGDQLNTIFYLPYTQLDGFVDYSATNASVDNNIHRVYGLTGVARQANMLKVDTAQEFQAALFYAQDSITNPATQNVTVTGIGTTSTPGSINNPYGVAGSATTIFVANFEDGYISSFDYNGNFIQRTRSFDTINNVEIQNPQALWYDNSTDLLYIADTFNNRIVVSDSQFVLKSLIGANNGNGAPGGNFNNGFVFGFRLPKGVHGIGKTFYVADSGNNQIQKFEWNTIGVSYSLKNVFNVTKTGSPYSSIQGLVYLDDLNDPRGLAVTSFGGLNYLYVTDYYNQRVLCGIDSNNSYTVHQILGENSGGFGIANTNLISVVPASTVGGVGAGFTFYTTINGSISTIGIASGGSNYSNLDKFFISYNGVLNYNRYFNVYTNGGSISTAFVSYGISTINNLGFNHPSDVEVFTSGNRFNLLISDTDNSRIISYRGFSGVGLGSTNNQMVFNYTFGTQGTQSNTSSLIYFNRPTGIFAQQGFTSLLVADTLKNKIHSLSTNFAQNTISGITTFEFGTRDENLSSGGVQLTKPVGYYTISTSFLDFCEPNSNWYFGDVGVANTCVQAEVTTRFNFCLIPQYSIIDQDYVAFAFKTQNETSSYNLGFISCYFIYNGGQQILFDANSFTSPSNNIRISSYVAVNSAADNWYTGILPIQSFGMISSPTIFGFGYIWTLPPKSANVRFKANQLPSGLLNQNNYGYVENEQVRLGATDDSVFIFNKNKFATPGTYVYRFDTGATGAARFEYTIFNFKTNNETILFSFRIANTLNEINVAAFTNFNGNGICFSGQLNSFTSGGTAIEGRYIDIQVRFASLNREFSPILSEIILFYSVLGQLAAFSYDTNIDNPAQLGYPRYKWSLGTEQNLNVTLVENTTTDEYEISILNTSNVGDYNYLSWSDQNFYSADLSLNQSSVTEESLIDIKDVYIPPYQIFSKESPQSELNNAQHFIEDVNLGYFIADTENDRLLQFDLSGKFVKAIQGNITLPRVQRDFVLLGSYYNTKIKTLFVTFSQYFINGENYLQNMFLNINNTNYSLNNPSYFFVNNSGKHKPNASAQSATFYIVATSQMDSIISAYSSSTILQINSPLETFLLNSPSSDDNEPENYTITFDTTSFPEFSPLSNLGVGTILGGTSNQAIQISDPQFFYINQTGDINTTLIAYNSSSTTQFNIPVQVQEIYFDNIFKPININIPNSNILVLSCVGNYAMRTYDLNFNLISKVPYTIFNFNEKLGGSAVALDSTSNIPDMYLVSQVGFANTIIGSVSIFKSSTNTFVNTYQYKGYDAVKSIVKNTNFSTILYDREANGLRSRIIETTPSGAVVNSYNNIFSKPTSITLKENNSYYITDNQGSTGPIFDRVFVLDFDTNGTSGTGLAGANTSGSSDNQSGGSSESGAGAPAGEGR
jgi:hypothetical protein